MDRNYARQTAQQAPATDAQLDGEGRHHHASGPHRGVGAEARGLIVIVANQLADGAVEGPRRCDLTDELGGQCQRAPPPLISRAFG